MDACCIRENKINILNLLFAFYFLSCLLLISPGKKPSLIKDSKDFWRDNSTGCEQNIIDSWNPNKFTDLHIVKYMLKI